MARHSKPKFARGREEPSKPTRTTYLIVCEGTQTEPQYFKCFRKGMRVEEFNVVGTGMNTLSLVQFAIEIRDEELDSKVNRDEIWCVFDKDSFPSENFNTAIQLAHLKGIKVAYSNEAFELWYLLHFHSHQSALSRTQYKKKLTECLGGRKYEKNDPEMYEILLPKQAVAIRNAKRLIQMHTSNSPAEHNPVTTVFELVESLNSPE